MKQTFPLRPISFIAFVAALASMGGPGTAAPGDLLFSVQPPDVRPNDRSGSSVAVGDGFFAIGSPGDNPPGIAEDVGSINLFDSTTGQHLAKLEPTGGVPGEILGDEMLIEGDMLIARGPAPVLSGETIAFFFFDVSDPADPIELTQMLPTLPVPSGGFDFANAIAVDGDVLAIGARPTSNGSVYLYDVSDPSAPAPISVITGPRAGEGFGTSVVLRGGVLAVGAPDAKLNPLPGGSSVSQGAVYVFDVQDPATPVQAHRLFVPGISQSDLGRLTAGVLSDSALIAYDSIDDTLHAFEPTTGAYLGSKELADIFLASAFGLDGTTLAVGNTGKLGPDDTRGVVKILDVSDPSGMVELYDVYPPAEAGTEFQQFAAAIGLRSGVLVSGASRIDTVGSDSGVTYVYDTASSPNPCGPADLSGDGLLNNTDINLFVSAFLATDAAADFNADGNFNNTDVNLFVAAFLAGCGG